MTAPRLSRATLDRLPRDIAGLTYDPRAITPGIVHIGPGAFHRAHMARYVHALMNRGQAMDWGIVGVGLMPGDARVCEALGPQDGLYTLIERDDDRASAQVVGSITDILGPGAVDRVLDRIQAPGVRIVSLTVSETGYCLDAETRRLDFSHPAIVADLATPRAPTSPIGILVEACRRRRDAGRPAFTALSCDNLPGNGRLLRNAVLALAGRIDAGLAEWIGTHARFPGTMVDRITPVTRPADVAAFEAAYGIADRWPIFCEPFTQWVIEDDFADGRPDWEAVGVQFTADVEPFEQMKLRLLNASHLALASVGWLAGHRMVAEAMRDPRLERYIRALMRRETAPTLPAALPVDLQAYQDRLVKRFSNRTLEDTLERINTDASLNLLLDPIRDRLEQGRPFNRLAIAVAAWIRRLATIGDGALVLRHPLADDLRARARSRAPDPGPVLAMTDIFGSLSGNPVFVAAVRRWSSALDRACPGIQGSRSA
ncbi:mannitol dehydrogenase family protein [Brevundimonas subvibrioides]|uniref:mannitol dehydrogenase family protein n=1 Tax=Brevundimonas subvibrioides TaxID=74313 RepID=UPI0022B364F3|nr:mannitol dehydrogenase family protein [Brevundimonas subvibrioides]